MSTMKNIKRRTLAKSAKFNHQEHADRLAELNTQAQAARRVDVALGLYCFELKEIHLQYGQFGKWLAEHCPQLVEKHSTNGNPQPSGSLETAMWMAKSALEVCGYKIGDYIELLQTHFPCTQGNCDSRHLMLLPAVKLPKEFQELREQIFDLVDGKSQRQLRAEFKQIEDGKVKHGRLKGSGGATREQRELAKVRDEEEIITMLKAKAIEVSNWLMEYADPKGLGMIAATPEGQKLQDAIKYTSGFFRHQT